MKRTDDLEGLTEGLRKAVDPEVRRELWDKIYVHLKQMAQMQLAKTGRLGVDNPTEIVHALYEGLDRAIANPDNEFPNRNYFFGYVTTAMKNLLVLKAERAKREVVDEFMDERNFSIATCSPALALMLQQAIRKVSAKESRGTEAFLLRYSLGCSHEEILERMADQYKKTSLIASDLTRVRELLAKELKTMG